MFDPEYHFILNTASIDGENNNMDFTAAVRYYQGGKLFGVVDIPIIRDCILTNVVLYLHIQILVMQIQKTDTRNIILDVARAEFKVKGFKDASMRMISQKAGVGLSNIYNYFKNKDEILREILSGVLTGFDSLMEDHNRSEHTTMNVFSSDVLLRKQIDIYVNMVEKFKEDLKLLLFNSAGSSLENFREYIIERHTKTGMEYISIMKKKYPDINDKISAFFIHTISSSWISIISELVMHDLSHDELEKFIGEYMEFSLAGWKKIMRVDA